MTTETSGDTSALNRTSTQAAGDPSSGQNVEQVGLRPTAAKLSGLFFQRYAGFDREPDPNVFRIWTKLEKEVAPALEGPTGGAAQDKQRLSVRARQARQCTKRGVGDLHTLSAPSGRFLWLWEGGALSFSTPSLQHTERGNASGQVEPPRKGKLAAFLQHDTLAVDLTLSTGLPEGNLRPIGALNPDGTLLPSVMEPSIGQSLLLIVTTEPNEADLRSTATEEAAADLSRRCASRLLQGQSVPEPRTTGRLLGGPLCEFEVPPPGPPADHLPPPLHLLVWVHLQEETTKVEAAGEYYYPLLRLLVSRAKIQFSYRQARSVFEQNARKAKTDLKDRYTKLGALPEEEDEKLSHLEKHLDALPKEVSAQAHCLQEIQLQKTTLQTNRHNYEAATRELEQVGDQARDLFGLASDVSGLVSFAEEARQLERQVETDLQYLRPGEALASHVLGSVQAQTDLLARRQHQRNQAKERKVERRIKWIAGAIGAVLTVGTITATVGEKAVSDLLGRWEITPDAYGIMGPVIAETLAQLLLGVGITLLLAAVALVVTTPVLGFTWLVRRAWRWLEGRQPPGDD